MKIQKNETEKIEIKNLRKENVPIAIMYKNGKSIYFEVTKDASIFEIYGFLKCYLKDLEFDLVNGLEGNDK